MCGICGKISVNGNVSGELIRKMCRVLTHRGPDDEGVYVKEGKGKSWMNTQPAKPTTAPGFGACYFWNSGIGCL